MTGKNLDLRLRETEDNLRKMIVGLNTIEKSGIRQDLVVLMLQDITGLGKTQIKAVLEALPKLEKRYLK